MSPPPEVPPSILEEGGERHREGEREREVAIGRAIWDLGTESDLPA